MNLKSFTKGAIGIAGAPFGLGTALSLAETGSNIYMQTETNRQQRNMFEDAQSFTKEQLMNRYQWTMQDLAKSGLNPILGISKGISAAGTGGPSPPNLKAPEAKLDTMLRIAQLQNISASTAKTAAETKVIKDKGEKHEVEGTLWNRAGSLFKQMGNWVSNSARDAANRINYYKQEFNEQKQRGFKAFEVKEQPAKPSDKPPGTKYIKKTTLGDREHYRFYDKNMNELKPRGN